MIDRVLAETRELVSACGVCGPNSPMPTDPSDPLAPIREVYERFKHMDPVLSNAAIEPDDPVGKTAWALWAAVKRALGGLPSIPAPLIARVLS